MDYRVHGILQTRILERVAIPFSMGSLLPRNVYREQKQTHRYGKQTCDYQKKEGRWEKQIRGTTLTDANYK